LSDYTGHVLTTYFSYVGILHEIDSQNSTVSLEQVRSFGTEGRKGDAALEIPASENVFEYIVFRGSDVKDLRVESSNTAPAQASPTKPQDPAIVEVSVLV
jgi:protein LSM14